MSVSILSSIRRLSRSPALRVGARSPALRVGGLALVAALAVSTASASPGGDAAGHGAEGGHADGHGDPSPFTGDADHDGTPNWMDADNEHYSVTKLAFHGANFLLFAGLLGIYGLPAMRSALGSRALLINKDLVEAARLKAEAEARHAEIAARLASLEAELDAMRTAAVEAGKAEEAKLGERAREAAARIAETTERQIRDEAERARAAIRREAVEAAVTLAQGILRQQVQPADQRRLAQEFLDAVQHAGAVRE